MENSEGNGYQKQCKMNERYDRRMFTEDIFSFLQCKVLMYATWIHSLCFIVLVLVEGDDLL